MMKYVEFSAPARKPVQWREGWLSIFIIKPNDIDGKILALTTKESIENMPGF